MRLAGLYVDGWGILHDFTLDESDLGRALCVVYGPNEAGKSTLLSFIKAILFGFKAGVEGYEPLRGGRRGGHLLLEDRGAVYRVQRYGRGRGRATVELPGGDKAGEDFLRANILRGISPVLFNNVFALGMDELRRLEDLQKDEISAYIYGAGTGASPRSLAAATAELDKIADSLFRPRGRTQELNQLLIELEDLDRRIRVLEQQPHRYLELRDKLAELEAWQQKLRDELSDGRRRLDRLGTLTRARGVWQELRNCQKALRQRVQSRPPGNVEEMLALLEQTASVLDRLTTMHDLYSEQKQRLGRLEERLQQQREALRRAGQGRVNALPALAALVLLGVPGVVLLLTQTIIPGLLLTASGLALAALLYAVPTVRAQERRCREQEMRDELAQLEEERVGAQAQIDRLGEQRADLEENLRQAARALTGRENLVRQDVAVLRQELLAERDDHRRVSELRRQLLSMAGSSGEMAKLEQELAAGVDCSGELHQLQTTLAGLEEQLQHLAEDRAAAKTEMEALETGDELARARQRREMLRETLSRVAGRWQTVVLARALLDLAIEKHERERQPAVLALASEYIGPMTGGRYTRVVAPVGAAQLLEAEESGGRRVPARALSRGAAAQLYLAVRLALARHLGTVLAPMPVILDDVLVDFDAARLQGALQVLAQVAQNQQLILFTCHQHILTAAAAEQSPTHTLVKMQQGV